MPKYVYAVNYFQFLLKLPQVVLLCNCHLHLLDSLSPQLQIILACFYPAEAFPCLRKNQLPFVQYLLP